jgi:hypothetical protein
VLVERVDNLTPEADWCRAYAEIEEFEEQLTDHGIVLVKYWLHITRDEQQRRFGTGQVTLQELEADRGRLAKPGEVGRLCARRE